jgi:hypothetical protein
MTSKRARQSAANQSARTTANEHDTIPDVLYYKDIPVLDTLGKTTYKCLRIVLRLIPM